MPERSSLKIFFDQESHYFQGITPEVLNRLQKTFPGIDVEHELNKMCLWLESEKGSKRKGNLRFISSWLERTYKSIPQAQVPITEKEFITSVPKILEDSFNAFWSLKDNFYQEVGTC